MEIFLFLEYGTLVKKSNTATLPENNVIIKSEIQAHFNNFFGSEYISK